MKKNLVAQYALQSVNHEVLAVNIAKLNPSNVLITRFIKGLPDIDDIDKVSVRDYITKNYGKTNVVITCMEYDENLFRPDVLRVDYTSTREYWIHKDILRTVAIIRSLDYDAFITEITSKTLNDEELSTLKNAIEFKYSYWDKNDANYVKVVGIEKDYEWISPENLDE